MVVLYVLQFYPLTWDCFFHLCLLKFTPTFNRQVSNTADSSLWNTVRIFLLAGATTFVHETLMRCMMSWVECATQNIVLTLALLVHSFCFQLYGQHCSSDGFSFWYQLRKSSNKYMKNICYIILKDDWVERVQKVM